MSLNLGWNFRYQRQQAHVFPKHDFWLFRPSVQLVNCFVAIVPAFVDSGWYNVFQYLKKIQSFLENDRKCLSFEMRKPIRLRSIKEHTQNSYVLRETYIPRRSLRSRRFDGSRHTCISFVWKVELEIFIQFIRVIYKQIFEKLSNWSFIHFRTLSCGLWGYSVNIPAIVELRYSELCLALSCLLYSNVLWTLGDPFGWP